MTGVGVAGLMLPFGRAIAAEALVETIDVAKKKALADAAMGAATAAGASYCDVRIGRYLRQFVITREDKVQNVVNTESTGIGIRVLVNGAWGFAATNELGTQGVVKAAQQAAAIARANSKHQTTPVQLAKAPGVGEVSWKTPIRKNSMEVSEGISGISMENLLLSGKMVMADEMMMSSMLITLRKTSPGPGNTSGKVRKIIPEAVTGFRMIFVVS